MPVKPREPLPLSPSDDRLLQSPCEALSSRYSFVHVFWSVVINWALNTGITFAVESDRDYVGFSQRPNSRAPASTPMVLGLAISGFLIVFISSLIMTCSARRNV